MKHSSVSYVTSYWFQSEIIEGVGQPVNPREWSARLKHVQFVLPALPTVRKIAIIDLYDYPLKNCNQPTDVNHTFSRQCYQSRNLAICAISNSASCCPIRLIFNEIYWYYFYGQATL